MYLYGVFWVDPKGCLMWAMGRNRKRAEHYARAVKGYVTRMRTPGAEVWDAPTFKVCSELVADYRPKGVVDHGA